MGLTPFTAITWGCTRSLAICCGAPTSSGPTFERVAYVDGLENPTENFTNITEWLVHQGFSDDDIVAVLGGNIVRALKEIWPS